MGKFAPLPLIFLSMVFGARAQGQQWSPGVFEHTYTDAPPVKETSVQGQIGPLRFDFFCQASDSNSKDLLLGITPIPNLGGRWRDYFQASEFDGRVLVWAGEDVVGDVESYSHAASNRVFLRFIPGGYELPRLVSGQNLRLEFEDSSGQNFMDLNLEGADLGPLLCPVVAACGRDVDQACGVFTAIRGANTSAVPLTETLNEAGEPRWFKSEFQKPTAALPYFRTASIFDSASSTELHISCLAEEGESLALNFIRRGREGVEPLFPGAEFDDVGEIVWETDEIAGRWTQMQVYPNGEGLVREGISSDLMMRVTLEELMTTDQDIAVSARLKDQEVTAQFTPAGSRDAICAVMIGCGVSLGFSPACASRQ